MCNIPMTQAYDAANSLVMMLDLEPRGELMQSVPSWFGHHLSRILDTVYEGHRLPHTKYDGLWEWNTIKLHTDSITLMDTFSTTKVPKEKLDAAKRDGARSFCGWLAERILVAKWILKGIASTKGNPENRAKEQANQESNGLEPDGQHGPVDEANRAANGRIGQLAKDAQMETRESEGAELDAQG